MELNKIEMSRGDARRHYQEYRTALKQQRTRQIAELAITYWQLSRGRQVIDVFEAFKAAGLKDDGSALALCRADRKQVFLEKQFDGSAKFFGMSEGDIRQGRNPDFELPRDFFAWKRTNGLQNGPIVHPRCRTLVPLIPPPCMPPAHLSNYHLLWEIDRWEPAPPDDPVLLRRITANIFVVMAQWNLTAVEKAVMRGAITLA